MTGSLSDSALPIVDVVIPTLNERKDIDRCLDCVFAQDYPDHLVKVMAVDTGSSDGTLEILLRRAQDEHRLVVIDGRGRNVPEALNLVLGNCTGKLLARVDAHGYVEREYLSCAVSALNSAPSNVACVGGRAIQEGRTVFGQAAALARQSRFGVGASQYAGRARAGPVETVNWGVYRRDAILAVGGFDPAMVEG